MGRLDVEQTFRKEIMNEGLNPSDFNISIEAINQQVNLKNVPVDSRPAEQYNRDTIELYQARYVFPLLAPTFFIMLAVDQDEDAWFTVPQAVWVTVCISLCQTITLHTLLLRFVQGANERWELNLNKNIEWWWSAPVSPMMVWFLTTCLATAALGTSMAMLTRTAEKHA